MLTTLAEAGITLIDCVHKTPPAADEGYPYIAIPQMKEGRIDFEAKPRLISESDLVEWTKKADPRRDDIVLSRRCNPGETAYVTGETKFALGQNLVLLRSDGRAVYPPFLRWLVRSPQWWDQVGKFLNVGAVFDSLRCADIPNFELPIPSLSVQKRIEGILSAFDNKIALNRQINTTLESMAQALFKSWFVDFDPVIDNALAAGNEIPDALQKRAAARAARREALRQQTSKTTNKTTGATDAVSVEQALPETGLSDQRLPCEIQQLFPDRFVFTEEMGWVPEGWEPAQIKDIAEYGNSRVDAVEIDRDNYVSTENMLVDKAGVVAASSVPEAAQVPSYEKGSILISNIRPYFKKIWLASHSGGRSNDVLEFKVKAAGTEGYLYSLLCQDLFFEYMMATSKGTKMPRGDKQAIMNWSVAVPSVDLQELFSEQVSLFQDSIVSRNEQSVCLANLRDSLLPKLLSGQITIPDAEQQLAEVL